MKIVFEGIKIAMMLFLIGLFSYVLGNAAKLEQDYMSKYEAMYENLVVEHEQQLIVGEMIQSQQAWERTADSLRISLSEERAKADQIKLQFEVEKYELYVFMKILERDFPGVASSVISEINRQRQTEIE